MDKGYRLHQTKVRNSSMSGEYAMGNHLLFGTSKFTRVDVKIFTQSTPIIGSYAEGRELYLAHKEAIDSAYSAHWTSAYFMLPNEMRFTSPDAIEGLLGPNLHSIELKSRADRVVFPYGSREGNVFEFFADSPLIGRGLSQFHIIMD